jgi:hypothetical protein
MDEHDEDPMIDDERAIRDRVATWMSASLLAPERG